jgi:hypothetical protein
MKADWYVERAERALEAVVHSTTANMVVSSAFLFCLLSGKESLEPGFAGIHIEKYQAWVLAAMLFAFYVAGALGLARLKAIVEEARRDVGVTLLKTELASALVLHAWLMNPFARCGERGETWGRGLRRNTGICSMILLHHLDMLAASKALASAWKCGYGEVLAVIVVLAVTLALGAAATRAIHEVAQATGLDHVERCSTLRELLTPHLWRPSTGSNGSRTRWMRISVAAGSVIFLLGNLFIDPW